MVTSGSCTLPICHQNGPSPGTLEHILLECDDLAPSRRNVFRMWADFLKDKEFLFPIINQYIVYADNEQKVQFILDCSVLPEVIELKQQNGKIILNHLFYLTRTLCFSIHKTRCRLLGTWRTDK